MAVRDVLRRIFLPWSRDALLYEVTTRCNLRCAQCYNVWKDDVGYPEVELPTAKALALIRKAVSDSRCIHFTLTGGEPALRKDLETLVAEASGLCKNVTLITNGTLLEDGRVRSLVEAGVDLFELPLNAADRAVHDDLAGVPGAFDKVTRAAAEIRYRGAELAFVFVGTSRNIGHWKEALELGIALGARGFLFNRYNAGGEGHEGPEKLLPSVEQVRRGLEVAEAYASRYGIGIGASIAVPPCLVDHDPYPHVGFGFCSAGTENAYTTLDPVGNVRPCNHTPTILGNLFEAPLRTLLASPALKAFRKARPSFCRSCRREEECLGGCKAAGEVCYGSLSEPDPFLKLNLDKARKPAGGPGPKM
ncbi:MAG: radical SAM protein [Planctomycetota bacterium]|jgi:pyrroloquinoline quinone biosynthesis protein E